MRDATLTIIRDPVWERQALPWPLEAGPADGRIFDPEDIARACVDLPPGVVARMLNTDTGQHVDLLDTGEIVGPKYDTANKEPELLAGAPHAPPG